VARDVILQINAQFVCVWCGDEVAGGSCLPCLAFLFRRVSCMNPYYCRRGAAGPMALMLWLELVI
jgi:hypothetical protein